MMQRPTRHRPTMQRKIASSNENSCLDASAAMEASSANRDETEIQENTATTSIAGIPLDGHSHFRSEKSHVISRSPKRNPASRGVNVAMLAGRYNKDDKALASESQLVPGSKWTSSGLIGTSPNLNNNRKIITSIKDKKRRTPINDNNLPPWHAAVKDQNKLPETMV